MRLKVEVEDPERPGRPDGGEEMRRRGDEERR